MEIKALLPGLLPLVPSVFLLPLLLFFLLALFFLLDRLLLCFGLSLLFGLFIDLFLGLALGFLLWWRRLLLLKLMAEEVKDPWNELRGGELLALDDLLQLSFRETDLTTLGVIGVVHVLPHEIIKALFHYLLEVNYLPTIGIAEKLCLLMFTRALRSK